MRPENDWFSQHAIYAQEGLAPTLRGQQNDPAPRILRWQNKKEGVILDEIAPSLRASGGTDIRKKPVVFDENINGKIYEKEICPTLRSPRTVWNKKLWDGIRIRRLTPVECERLQGFPDDWTEGISDTQRYKCLGNAVTVNVIEFLGRRISHFLTKGD